jgi:hypothetical protein
MLNCYRHILTTYLTKFRGWVYLAIMFCVGLSILAEGGWPSFALLFIGSYLLATVQHLRQQFASPQATVVPHYRARHLTVAGILALPVFILTPICVSLGYHLPLLPLVSVILASGAIIAWTAWMSFFPMHFAFAVSCFWWPNHFFGTIAEHLLKQPPTGMVAAIFIVALAGFVLLVTRLMHLTEEMPEYYRPISIGGSAKSGHPQINTLSTALIYSSRWPQISAAKNGRFIDDLAFIAIPSLAQRLHRWRIAGNTSRDWWLLGLLFGIPSLLVGLCFGKNAPFFIICVYAWPTTTTLFVANARRTRIGYQSLYPISRSRLLKDHGLLLVYEWSQIWSPVAVAYILGTVIATGHAPTFSFILSMILATTGQMLVLAIAFWLLSFSSLPLPLLSGTVCVLSIALGLFPDSIGPTAFLIIAAILLTLMALILHDAYRRWMTTDLA